MGQAGSVGQAREVLVDAIELGDYAGSDGLFGGEL